MSAFLCLLLTVGASGFYRAPLQTDAPALKPGPVWVYFTDKGVTDDAELTAALTTLAADANPAARLRRNREPVRGFDFDDLPVRVEYVRRIETMGARLRTTSNWLNAASFELPATLVREVWMLPFVYDVRPVAREHRVETDIVFPIDQPADRRSRAVDSATAHRYYGPSFDQAYMMGVPDLYYKGWYGSGVKLAIFDTGLRLDNQAVSQLRIHKQHDFLSGDNFYSAGSATGWHPQLGDRLRFLGLVKDPALAITTTGDAMLLYCADSFSYRYNSPRRAIYSTRTTDHGATWNEPEAIILSSPASQVSFHTFENLALRGAGFATYLTYDDISYSYSSGLTANTWLTYHTDIWQPAIRIGPGRWPDLHVVGNDLFIAYVDEDSVVRFRSANISDSLPYPAWVVATSTDAPEPLGGLKLGIAGTNVVIIATGLRSGTVYQFRSTDMGATWGPAEELLPADAYDIRLAADGAELLLLYKDVGTVPFTRLSALHSTDLGLAWTQRAPLTDSTLALGGIAAHHIGGTGVNVLYEATGMLYRTSSTDFGATWQTPALIDTAGFCYQPCIAGPDDLLAAWVKRGDDNSVWEPADTLKFSLVQPDHGTRMASIIAGYAPTGIIGIAPGVELLIARTELHKVANGRYYEFDLEEDTYIQALEWAEAQGADIVSTSLGYRGWYTDDQMDGKTAPISVAANLAAQRGLIIVTAMGNRDTTRYPFDRAYIVAPADAEGVISAGGVERDGSFWRGTGTGPTADGRPKPELVALSDTVAVVDPDTITGLEGSVGTSCATALIAGACALLREAHPDWSADSLKAVLFASAGRSTQSCTFGFGVPRVDSAFAQHPPEPGIEPMPDDHVQAFPNPFLPAEHGRVYFELELARPSTRPQMFIYSVSGTLIDTFSLNPEPMGRPGRYDEIAELNEIGAWWDGTNFDGKPVAAGLYLVVLHTTFGQGIGKFALVR